MKMSSLSRVGLGLSVIFICLLLALIGEIYYLLWWKRRIIKRDIEVNCRKSRNEIGCCLFFWKKQANSTPNSQIHHQSTTEQEFQFHPQNTSKNYMLTSLNENGGFEAFTGPPRFLFTINEETREDLAESEDGREGKKSLSDLLKSVEISNPNNKNNNNNNNNTSPNYLTPISSPQYGTPPITPIGSCHSSQSGGVGGYNPFYESSNDAEFSKIVKSSSPPPKFKFLRDAEEKLQRRIMLMEKEEDEEGKNGGSSLFKKCEEDGSFIRIIVAKNKENEKGIHHYHSPLFYSGDSSSSSPQVLSLPSSSSPSNKKFKTLLTL